MGMASVPSVSMGHGEESEHTPREGTPESHRVLFPLAVPSMAIQGLHWRQTVHQTPPVRCPACQEMSPLYVAKMALLGCGPNTLASSQ